jgi:hypothetical protein
MAPCCSQVPDVVLFVRHDSFRAPRSDRKIMIDISCGEMILEESIEFKLLLTWFISYLDWFEA